jgi:hypothetical protein
MPEGGFVILVLAANQGYNYAIILSDLSSRQASLWCHAEPE